MNLVVIYKILVVVIVFQDTVIDCIEFIYGMCVYRY